MGVLKKIFDFRRNLSEEEELNALYAEGTIERQILEYSRAKHPHQAVPPMLMMAFKLLMGIAISAGIVGFFFILFYG